jgi:uncharacterized protein YndB with AHSA1/START domain
MNAEQTLAAVRRSVTVKAAVEKAFAVFTESFGTWWPADYHVNPNGYETAFIEPRLGGRWFERAPDGSESDWGRVLAWEPPHRILLSWQLNGEYVLEPDQASEVEITFTAEGGGRTRVDLTHSKFEGLTGGDSVASTVGGASGWSAILPRFVAAAEA